MVDIIVEQIYDLVRAIWPFYVRFQEFALSKFPYAAFIVLASTVINATLATHAAGKDKPKAYWLHSLVQTVCAGFGGGIITPVILGQKPSIIFANELVIPMTVLMWYLVNYWNFDTVLNWKPIKLLWNVVVSVFRTNGMVNMVTLGCEKFPASPYYPTPFMGPLIGGTLINSLGSFLPADRGLGAIQNGTAWALQSAFVTAALFFFIVKDREGIIGQVVRFFTGDLSVRATRALVCGLQVITLGSQVIFDDPNANFFTPIHKALYAITGVQAQRPPVVPAIPAAATATVKDVDAKPATPAKPEVPKKKGMTFARFARYVYMLFAGFMALYYLGFKVPAPSIPSVSISSQKMDKAGGMTITLDALPIDGISVLQPLGRCQWSPLMPDLPASQLQQCQPMTLKLFEHVECATSAESCAPSKTSTLLKDRKALKTTFRLSVTQTAVSQSTHDASATVYSSPSTSSTALAANSSDQLENRNSYNNQFLWLSELPVEFSSAEDLSIADPNYSIDSVQLFVTAEGELVLLSSVDITGTIFDPRKVSGRVLWRAQPERHCGNKPGSGLGSVATTALRLSVDSHVPQLQCSDGDNVDLDIGTLLVNKQAFQSVNRVKGAIPAMLGRSGKSEL